MSCNGTWNLKGTIQAIALAPRARLLFVSAVQDPCDGNKSTLAAWHLTGKHQVGEPAWSKQIDNPFDANSCLITSIDEKILFGGSAKAVYAWSTIGGNPLWAAKQAHISFVTTLIMSHNGNDVLSGSVDGLVKVWNATDGKQQPDKSFDLERIHGIKAGGVNALALARDGQTLFVGNANLYRWHMSKHECTCIAVFSKAPTIGVRALEVIPQGDDMGGDLLCIGTYTDAIYLWHMTGEVCKINIFTPSIKKSGAWHIGAITALSALHLKGPKGPVYLSSSSWDRDVKIWRTAQTFSNEGKSLEATQDSKHSVSSANEPTSTIACICTLRGHNAPVTALAVHPSLPIIVSGDKHGIIKAWALENIA